MKFLARSAATAVVLSALLAICSAGWGWSIVVIIWAVMMVFVLSDPRHRAYLGAFLLAFFIFLMGRETLVHVADYGYSSVGAQADGHLHRVLAIGLAVTWLGYAYSDFWGQKKSTKKLVTEPSEIDEESGSVLEGMRLSSQVLLTLAWPAAIYASISQAQRVLEGGYADLYTDASSSSDGGLAAIVDQLGLVYVVAFCVYLGTMPKFRSARIPLALWAMYLFGSLGSGQRGTFIAGGLMIVCYSVTRSRLTPNDRWITRKGIICLALATPVLLGILVSVEEMRGVGGEYGNGFGKTALDFVYSQGVSATVITNGFVFQQDVPVQNYLLEFLHSGLPARLMDIPVIQGNSVARATEGASYGHALAFVVLGDAYLAGRGTGSSYLAEGYQVFGLAGVMIVSWAFGLILRFVDGLSRASLTHNAVRLLVVQPILWAPRGSATGFLSTLFAPSTLGTLAAILLFGHAHAQLARNTKVHLAARQPTREQESA